MSKKKYNLNTIYISERLQENLKPISQSAFTAVTAPMGYGKTTAINWYLDKQSKNGNSCVIRISIYSDNLSVFWQSVQKAFAFAGLDFLDNYICPSDAASAGMLADELCYSLSSQTSYYIFIDDFHLLGEPHVADFFCMLANRLPENIHLIVSGRNAFLSGKDSPSWQKVISDPYQGSVSESPGAFCLYPSLRCQPERRSAEHASLFQ